MSTEEEKEPVEPEAFLAELDATIQSLEQRKSFDASQEIVGTLLPLLRDGYVSLLERIVQLEDIVDPVTISHDAADEIKTILKSALHANPDNTELHTRVNAVLEELGDDDEEEPEDAPSN